EADPVSPSSAAGNGATAQSVGSVESAAPATVVMTETRAVSDRPDRPRISPLARRLSRELGVDWTSLRGSGCTGRIRKVDVLAAARAGIVAVSPSSGRSVPIGSTRRTIAARMVESCRTTAPVTLNTTADATNLVNLRAQFKAASPPGRDLPGYTDFLV